MRVHNVHERVLPISMDKAAPLIDQLGQPDDLLFPTPQWPPMVLDGPLQPGSSGGHGPMRYHVQRYEPGRLVEFATEPGMDIVGTHAFSLEKVDDDHTILRHTIEGELEGTMRLAWPTAVRPIHDAMVEDILDQAERVAGQQPRRRQRWSPWVRFLRRVIAKRARRTEPPHTELLENALPGVDFIDAHEIPTRKGMPMTAEPWADALFGSFPKWVTAAMGLRQAVVGLIGINRQPKDQAFTKYASTPTEVLLGSDEKHLDFRVSIKREPERVVATTVVQVHNARGRAYWVVVGPIHPIVLRSMLSRTARRLADESHH
ncbi:DUF2867 domain-containing protein [Tenggerimyces flavus]|uniref:DUF2867 domain-containing protein n=1 Tax=Tenggerimyces flavus TaxID=1708749 RepID=A0ABV7YKA2_9ACTN|nr:DUF2867 domain-containing protein [Tenggerimyces flavus]MBM7787546.1 hypothetical protein [Tenggerimyces flavus]